MTTRVQVLQDIQNVKAKDLVGARRRIIYGKADDCKAEKRIPSESRRIEVDIRLDESTRPDKYKYLRRNVTRVDCS